MHWGQKSYTPTSFGKLWTTPGVRCIKNASSTAELTLLLFPCGQVVPRFGVPEAPSRGGGGCTPGGGATSYQVYRDMCVED